MAVDVAPAYAASTATSAAVAADAEDEAGEEGDTAAADGALVAAAAAREPQRWVCDADGIRLERVLRDHFRAGGDSARPLSNRLLRDALARGEVGVGHTPFCHRVVCII